MPHGFYSTLASVENALFSASWACATSWVAPKTENVATNGLIDLQVRLALGVAFALVLAYGDAAPTAGGGDARELGDATIPKGIKNDWLPGSYFEPITNKKGPQEYDKFKVRHKAIKEGEAEYFITVTHHTSLTNAMPHAPLHLRSCIMVLATLMFVSRTLNTDAKPQGKRRWHHGRRGFVQAAIHWQPRHDGGSQPCAGAWHRGPGLPQDD